jgi:hypothetical protein
MYTEHWNKNVLIHISGLIASWSNKLSLYLNSYDLKW